ncbi:hypothetical protein K9N68_11845 [Kovacikia minuta CCNUW1]|uniref:hypothetical protein n=1 Tax=Kovacikia minuta TaxID=2931930 RepID=UPI001CC90882|nr:hypothetical protein [Kovacikia minuta]UBF28500.1 hypothetical protein K9N68_11845 [Kovacikia minuta CCNUW1]
MLNRLFQAAVITFLLSLMVGGTSLKLFKLVPLLGSLLAQHHSVLVSHAVLSHRESE